MLLAESTRVFVALNLLVIGLSHTAQPLVWHKLFSQMKQQGHVGVLWIGVLHFFIGSIVVSFHPVYDSGFVLVSILGWGWTLKGLLYVTVPSIGLRSLERSESRAPEAFRIAGAIMLTLGTWLMVAILF